MATMPPPNFARVITDDSSTAASEAESDSEHGTSTDMAKLTRELAKEKRKNTQLEAKLKRQTQLQGQLVRAARGRREFGRDGRDAQNSAAHAHTRKCAPRA